MSIGAPLARLCCWQCHNCIMRSTRRRTARLAVALWIALAVVVWNVVFDRVLVLAGRQYVHAATLAARGGGPYLRVDDTMRPARVRALRTATLAATVVLTAGVIAAVIARRRAKNNYEL